MIGSFKKVIRFSPEGTPHAVPASPTPPPPGPLPDLEDVGLSPAHPDSLFQVFLAEQKALDPELDNAVVRQVWNDMPPQQKKAYGRGGQAGPKAAKRPARFSRVALNNILKADPEVAGKLGKEAAECMTACVDFFAAELIKGSEVEMRKRNLKKKALKAEHLHAYMSQFNYRFWFCKDVRDDFRRAKEDKKKAEARKRAEEAERAPPKPAPVVSGPRITQFFGPSKSN